jgi:hypothetical protein
VATRSGKKTAPVGFCFSFPVNQTAVDAGTMIKLTKKFDNEGFVGCDPVQMLQQAIQRFKAPVSPHPTATILALLPPDHLSQHGFRCALCLLLLGTNY